MVLEAVDQPRTGDKPAFDKQEHREYVRAVLKAAESGVNSGSLEDFLQRPGSYANLRRLAIASRQLAVAHLQELGEDLDPQRVATQLVVEQGLRADLGKHNLFVHSLGRTNRPELAEVGRVIQIAERARVVGIRIG